MSPRVRSELLLVGSLLAETTESALRAGAEFFGDLESKIAWGSTGVPNGQPLQGPVATFVLSPRKLHIDVR